jgi:hypothetical protein
MTRAAVWLSCAAAVGVSPLSGRDIRAQASATDAEPQRGPSDILVIDRAERPTED